MRTFGISCIRQGATPAYSLTLFQCTQKPGQYVTGLISYIVPKENRWILFSRSKISFFSGTQFPLLSISKKEKPKKKSQKAFFFFSHFKDINFKKVEEKMKMKNIKKEMKDFMLLFAIIFAVPLSIAGMLFTAKAFIATTIISVVSFLAFCLIIIRSEKRKEKRSRA